MNIFSFFSEMAFTVSTLSYSFGQVSVIVAFKLSISADSTTLEFTIGNGRFSVTAMMGHIMANAMSKDHKKQNNFLRTPKEMANC